MPQSLLALLALAVAAFLTFNQQRLTIRAQTNVITDEVELAAAGLASEVMAFIEARSFDEASTPEKIHAALAVPSVASDFTWAAGFGAIGYGPLGCDLLHPADTPECDDVDDLAGLDWQTVTLDLAHGRTLDFDVRVNVYYVSDPESMTVAPGRTLHKRVNIDVRSPHVAGDEADGLLRLTRVVSFDPVKARKDYEDIYGPLGTS